MGSLTATRTSNNASAINYHHNNDNSNKKKIGFGFFIAALFYVGTGVIQPTLIDFLRINSCLGRKWLLLPTLANTTGLALGGIRTSNSEWYRFIQTWRDRPRFRRMLLYSAMAHLLSGMMLIGGLMLTGGAIYVVLYNSCPAWTALLAKYFVGRDLTRQQILGVMMVCVGLIVNVIGSKHQLAAASSKNQHEGDGDDTSTSDTGTVMMGSFIVLMGCILHSGFYVLAEISLNTVASSPSASTMAIPPTPDCCGSSTDNAMPVINNNHEDDCSKRYSKTSLTPTRSNNVDTTSTSPSSSTVSSAVWSCCLGTIEASCMILWIAIGISIGGFQQQPNDDINKNGDFILMEEDESSTSSGVSNAMMESLSSSSYPSCTVSNFVKGFFMLILVDGIHAGTFFLILEQVGAIGSALLKGMQTVAVVLLSAVFFCHLEATQCLSLVKMISIVLVISGTVCYAIGKEQKIFSSSSTKRSSSALVHSSSRPIAAATAKYLSNSTTIAMMVKGGKVKNDSNNGDANLPSTASEEKEKLLEDSSV